MPGESCLNLLTASLLSMLALGAQVYFVSSNDTRPHIPRVRMSVENSSWAETLDIKVISPSNPLEEWHTRAPQKALQAVIFWHTSHYGEPSTMKS